MPGRPRLLAGRTVARVGYGAMQLRNLQHDRDAATALLRRAVELGVNHVDTAQFYGDGLVNDLIREAIGPDDGVTVVSKVGADPDPGGPYPIRMAQRPGELAASVDANLASLGRGQIPVVNLRRALPAGIACVQNDYSLVSRGHEDMLRLCAGAGIAWVPYFPLGGALPGSPKVTDQPAVLAAAESLHCTPAQAGLAWLLRHAPNILLIPGTTSPGHLEENLSADALTIDTATLTALDAIRVMA